MKNKYVKRLICLALISGLFSSCSTGEIQLEKTEFKFMALVGHLDQDMIEKPREDIDVFLLNQVITEKERESALDAGYFVFSDDREVTLISRRPYVKYKRWLMSTLPGKQVPGVIYQLSYTFSGERDLEVFVVTLNDQVDIKDVAQRSETIDQLYLSISGSAMLIISSDDDEYTDVLKRRIARWKDAGVDGGDYTMYFSNVRDWEVDSEPLPKLLGRYIEAESHQKKILSTRK
ncbi:hypothetical protein LNTAR_01747 [Lentisphaera araneosa HTCC2155]|uniref:Lipoprotein n=1 Tax=Lentisphaera araneosa HTCC2155 TaxID=313628 RepID=A6DTJ0_9BACT|nr:hypothetical protein [Lentisphaera araneosa]EDM25029.1 hypothetical protein LNTAR_01747 [Lentisphaera araneosa HTCC2155]